MITHISINNYALINKLNLTMGAGFTTFTGETGAGKSILLGAIGLCLGKRADSQVLHDKTHKCVVELAVDLNKLNLEGYFLERDLDYFPETIIRREISVQGRSRSFVNDCPVKLDVLQHIGKRLVDVHSQHDTLLINSPAYQLSLVDVIAKNKTERDLFSKAYKEFKETLDGQCQFLKSSEVDIDVDYLTFLAEELAQADLKTEEVGDIENEIKTLENAEDIQTKLNEISGKLNSEEVGVLSTLSESIHLLNSISDFNPKYSALSDRLDSCKIELADIADEIEIEASNIEDNPKKLFNLQERYNEIQHLLRKHRAETVEELLEKLEETNQKILNFQNRSSEISMWEEKVEKSFQAASRKAEELTMSRKRVLPKLSKEINSICKSLNFSDPNFRIELSALNELKSNGNDSISFMFSANKGHEPKPLEKSASGGELSRVMLALKSILSKTHGLPTIIFDEIDTGVSGETAVKVAAILKEMGSEMQVWAITHLPQIAAVGEQHYQVLKRNVDGVTQTFIKELNKEQRIETVAQMLSGAKPTKAAVENARELLMVS